MQILAVSSQEMSIFVLVAGAFVVYIIAWFFWFMYRMYGGDRRGTVSWVDGLHFISIFIFMGMLQTMRRDYDASHPKVLKAPEVQSEAGIKLAGATLLQGASFETEKIKGYVINLEIPADKVSGFIAENQITADGEKDKDDAMVSIVTSMDKLNEASYTYIKEDVQSPRYMPLKLKNGEGLIIASTKTPGTSHIYLRLVAGLPAGGK